MRNVFRFAAALGAFTVTAAGCSGSTPSSSKVEVGTATTTPSPSPRPGTHAIAGFSGYANPKAGTLTFVRDPSPAAALGGTVNPDSLDTVTAPNGSAGSPPSGDVDIITAGGCVDNGAGSTFVCSDVEVKSAVTRSLANVYVQVDNETYTGCTSGCTGYDATTAASGTAAYYKEFGGTTSTVLTTTHDGAIARDHGIWFYNNPSETSAAAWPVLGVGGGGFDTGSQTWTFNNLDDQAVYYHFTVYATESWAAYSHAGTNSHNGTYGNYGGSTTIGGADDACSGGTSITAADLDGNGGATITLPFDFTLFNTNSTSLVVCPNSGEIAFNSNDCVNSENNSPENLASSPDTGITNNSDPQLFAFWDSLTFGSAANDKSPFDIGGGGPGAQAGQVCYKEITGTSGPNRVEVIEFRNMDFDPNGVNTDDLNSSLDFEVFLYEGTGEVDLYYANMVNGASTSPADKRANCADQADSQNDVSCFIGMQGEDGPGYNNGSTPFVGSGYANENVFASGGTVRVAFKFVPSP